MGMPVAVHVRDPAAGGWDPVIDAVFAWLHRVDALFSTHRAGSEVCRIDRGELDPRDADPEVTTVLARCEELREETGGYFDARAGGRLDPSGLVKGWAVERAAALLEEAGCRDFCIDAGGDIAVRGRWRVGIRHPYRRRRLAAAIELADAAIATSGTYERGPHILDPHTGAPALHTLSVSVTGPDLGTADAYATAAFAMGAGGPAWTASLGGHAAMTILPGGRVLTTAGWGTSSVSP
jgi:thiamine biosynthesis lipoprotein